MDGNGSSLAKLLDHLESRAFCLDDSLYLFVHVPGLDEKWVGIRRMDSYSSSVSGTFWKQSSSAHSHENSWKVELDS
jgi:hypothetical protein